LLDRQGFYAELYESQFERNGELEESELPGERLPVAAD
jgi:hypothetical protein